MTHRVSPFSSQRCALGEGPLWHPLRQELFWFDILGATLHARAEGEKERIWRLSEMASCAAWVDRDHLLIAGQSRLFLFDIARGRSETLLPFEEENDGTRSNDGRADPMGGFWVSSMGLNCETGAGAIYRFYRGELRLLHQGISIANSIAFSPEGRLAYFADGAKRRIYRQSLDPEGWPAGDREVFLDMSSETFFPDGSVTDASGTLWNAQWGAARVQGFAPSGKLVGSFDIPASQSSCPAFGGAAFDTLYVTSAADGSTGAAEGQTYKITDTGLKGRAEPAVLLR